MKNSVLLLVLIINFTDSVVLPSIPEHLRPCYSQGGPTIGAPRRLDVFLSLLKRLELTSLLDMRLLSTSLLRSLRLDGIEQSSVNAVENEFVLPYRASSFQFHKFKLLMDLFLPSQDLLDGDVSLTLEEKCLFHRMLSSTVRRWERGDEAVVCPVSAQQTQSMVTESSGNRIHSRCPIEEGVVQTDWGTISPGTIIAAVAAGLEYQRVSVTDILNANIFKEDIAEPLMASAKQEWYEDIETLTSDNSSQISRQQSDVSDIGNIWVATLAGDLAEVVVNQGPRVGSVSQLMMVGSNNRWNDTLLPRNYYIFPQNGSVIDWHFTDAEILAGIDGYILAHHVTKWMEERRTLRLSQIIEMYYSNEGVSFNSTIKACNRQLLFSNMVDSTKLIEETARFAHVLSLRQITVYIPVEEIERITAAAVTAFMNYVPTVIAKYRHQCQVSHTVPVMDLVVATDASWKGYDVEQFMSWIGNALELNLQRSTISLLHGRTGQWIVPPSNNLTAVFSHLTNFTDEWPTRLSLPSVFSSMIQHSLNTSLIEIANRASAGPSTVVLIVSPSDRPSTNEIERARSLLNTLRQTYFDVYFAYAVQDISLFQTINYEYMDYSELFLSSPSSNVQDIIEAVDTYLIKNDIPMRIMGAQCPFNDTVFDQVEYEDYVLPGRQKYYRIHPFYLRQQALINVQFRNDGQGQLMICTWRGADASHACQTIQERGTHIFNITTPCPSPDFCPPANFIVASTSTLNLCANNDCRLPNQVGYYLRHSGLRCLPLQSSAPAVIMKKIYIAILISMYLLCFL